MKYVALLSGGKDSCYNLLHCHKNGHELTAAASLGPEHGKEELDSYLYQTVGQDAIEFVAQALDVPLYRRVISGTAIQQGSEYGDRRPAHCEGVQGDETEDLHSLLSAVKNAHPDVLGVSVGAILSNYQRVRVEHVCRRLDLTPLCYLWQRDQAELLDEMIDSGMEAILIKVAGIGLTQTHLGKTLGEMKQTLIKLNTLYGSHICGEGGEYESLTLDCPLFKHRIILTDTETVIHSDSDFATVAYMRIKGAVLEKKFSIPTPNPRAPSILSSEFDDIRKAISASPTNQSHMTDAHRRSGEHVQIKPSNRKRGRWVSVANISRKPDAGQREVPVEAEVEECFHTLQDQLAKHSLQLSHCVNINILLSSMEDFGRVNAVYASFFGTSPPARAAVTVDLPSPIRIRIDCIAYEEANPADRQALHVQGLSYWAPANIGPYSQAITVDHRIFISGQIGLIPSGMSLPTPPSVALETALAFQHVDRVVGALKSNSGGGWKGHSQGAIYWFTDTSDVPPVKSASKGFAGDINAPALFISVSALPKGALVEKQVIYHTGQCLVWDDDDEIISPVVPCFHRGHVDGINGARVDWETSTFKETPAALTILAFRGSSDDLVTKLKLIPELIHVWSTSLSVRLFYRLQKAHASPQYFESLFAAEDRPAVTAIPCRSISTRDADDWDSAMYIVGS